MKIRKSFTEYLAIACIFSVFLDKAIRGILPFDLYYSYPVFIIFLISVFLSKGKIEVPPKWFMLGSLAIMISGAFITLYKNILGFELFKQVFGIYFTAFTYYNVLYFFNFDIRKIFRYYLFFAFLIALHGVIDNMLHYLGIHLTTINHAGPGLYREYGIMGEPFYLALALTPAVIYYLSYFRQALKKNKTNIFIIILCYLLTYSSIAVTGLCLGIFMSLYVNNYFDARRGKLLLAPFLIVPTLVAVALLINNIELISVRFHDTTSLFFSAELKTQEAEGANSSTFALYSNYAIARDSFIESPIFGSGLGSHPIIYEETFLKYFPHRYLVMYGNQNQQDANSKFLRLMSETGLVGLILFFSAFLKFRIPRKWLTNETYKNLGVINYSIWVYLILCLIRNGNYINIGFFLFFFIYYASWFIVKKGYMAKRS